MRNRRTAALATLSVAALVATAVAPSPAASATGSAAVVGATTAGPYTFGLGCGAPAIETCSVTFVSESVTAAHQAPGGAVVPAAGVITSWSVGHGPIQTSGGGAATATLLTVSLRVVRGAGAVGVAMGTGPTENLPQAAGVSTFAARLPVQVGDRIGYDLRFAPGNLFLMGGGTGSPGDVIGYAFGWPDGSTPSTYLDSSSIAATYLPISATVEPDADGDGYGDLTQDQCSTDRTTQAACVLVDTSITKSAAKKSTKRKATFAFSSNKPGSTFECALKGKKLDQAVQQFSSCVSPRKYKNLAPGKYTFSVRATDAAGNVDSTPATWKFKVLKKKKKK
jgi:hypothetical protein